MSENDEETGGVLVDHDTAKDQGRIDSLREKLPPVVRSMQHLDGSRKEQKSGTSHFSHHNST